MVHTNMEVLQVNDSHWITEDYKWKTSDSVCDTESSSHDSSSTRQPLPAAREVNYWDWPRTCV